MNCTVQKPTPQELFDKYKDMFSSIVLKGGQVIPESNEWYVSSLVYAVAEEFYAVSEQAWREKDPRYACCENLYDQAQFYGIYPKAASSSQGFIRITGQPGAALPTGMQFTFGSQKYVVAGTIPSVMPDSGFVAVRIRALVPGPDGNKSPGTTGTIDDSPAGLDPTVTMYGQFLCGGSDAEDCEQFRTRYMQRLSYTADLDLAKITDIVLEYPCATNVYLKGDACCELDETGAPICSDKIELYVLFKNTFDCGLAPQCIIDDLNKWLFGEVPGYGTGRMPFGICGEVLFVQGLYVNIRIDGLSCATPVQQREVVDRITEYLGNLPPSSNVQIRMLETIVAQVVGDIQFDIVIDLLGCDAGNDIITDECLPEAGALTRCGDLAISCDYKVCLNEIILTNTQVNEVGCI